MRIQLIFQAEYRELYLDYMNKISPEQKKAIKAERKLMKENKTIAAKKKTQKDEKRNLGKPKPPANSFTLFVTDQFRKNPKSKMIELTNDWAKLSDDQKQAYTQQAQQLRDAYE